MSKAAPKEFTKEAVAFFDGGVTAAKLKKQAAAASGAEAASLKEQAAKYSDKCYIILHGKVYDVTDFLAKHPGGPESILQVRSHFALNAAYDMCSKRFNDSFFR